MSFCHLRAIFEHFVHSEYQGVIRDENYDGFDVLFTNCTKSVWRAPIVYRGPVCETMG